MRRVIVVILSFLLLFALVGCCLQNKGKEAVEVSEYATSSVADDTQVKLELPTSLTLEDYHAYISEGELPDDFVTYEMVKDFGTFVSFVDFGYPRYHKYLYGLIDENGYHLSLLIEPKSQTGKPESVMRTSEGKDLRKSQEQAEFYAVGNILYEYYEGALYSISWESDMLSFTIKAGRSLRPADYPALRGTLLSRLLDAETAQTAVEEFGAHVAAMRQIEAAKTEK